MSDISMKEFVDALNAHTKALNAHTAEISKLAGGGSKSGGGSAGSSTKADAGATKKKKGPTLEDVQAQFGDFMSVTDKAERKERSMWLKKLCAEYEVERISEVDANKYGEVLERLKAKIAGEDEEEDDGGEAVI